MYIHTEWSKSLCAPDDYSTIIRCTETFWSHCIIKTRLFRVQSWLSRLNLSCLGYTFTTQNRSLFTCDKIYSRHVQASYIFSVQFHLIQCCENFHFHDHVLLLLLAHVRLWRRDKGTEFWQPHASRVWTCVFESCLSCREFCFVRAAFSKDRCQSQSCRHNT